MQESRRGVRWKHRFAAVVIGVALLLPFTSPAAPAAAQPPPQTATGVKRCVFTGRSPAPGSRVSRIGGRFVVLAVSGRCNQRVGRVTAFLDGRRVINRVFNRTTFLAAAATPVGRGSHRAIALIQGDGFTTWQFRVIR